VASDSTSTITVGFEDGVICPGGEFGRTENNRDVWISKEPTCRDLQAKVACKSAAGPAFQVGP